VHHLYLGEYAAAYPQAKLLGAPGLPVRDRAAARRSLETILAWDFDRVVVTHGRALETGGREALRRAFAWLPVGRPAGDESKKSKGPSPPG
jgi:hypothetical protein